MLIIVALLFVAACTGSATRTTDTVPPTTTSSTSSTTTTVAPPADPCAGPVSLAPPDPTRPLYTATAIVDPVAGTVDGTLSVTFTPDLPVDELIFRLWANAPNEAPAGAHIDVSAPSLPVSLNSVDPTTVRVPLGPTAAGVPMSTTLTYHLSLTGNDDDRVARAGDTL